MSTEKVEIDTKDVVSKLAFLVGKTIMFRTASEDSTVATNVLAVEAKNNLGAEGKPQVSIYTTVGVKHVFKSSQFNDIVVLNMADEDGFMYSLGKHVDEMGICF